MKLRKSKKGAIEIQVNWIFVIIVGGLILLFFFSLVKTTQSSSNKKLSQQLITHFDSILSGEETDVGTTRIKQIPKIDIDIDCKRMGISGASRQIPYKTLFSPDTISGRELVTYSKYFKMPYPVDYFVYLTSRQIRYNFLNSTGAGDNFLIKSLINSMPSNITYQIVDDISEVKENGYYKERFITIDTSPDSDEVSNSIKRIKNKDVTLLNIIPSDGTLLGSLEFYQKNGLGQFNLLNKSSYIGPEMLLGAMISDAKIYICNVDDKALVKFKIMTWIYQSRTNELIKTFSGYEAGTTLDRCKKIYESFSLDDVLSNVGNGLDFNYFTSIKDNSKFLYDANENAKLSTCPLIY